MAAKLCEVKNSDGSHYGWMFECPGCEHAHVYDKRWTFNGDLENPSFTPSLLNNGRVVSICHLYVTDGKIHFLQDCTHKFAGQTIDLPEWKDGPST